MSSANVIRDGFPGGNRRSYISTDTFTNRFYSYTTRTVDGVTRGIFSDVTDDDTLCPKGRILRENGRKLFPGANPDVTQYFVGVYDAKTFLNGFIDPNSRVFASFNTDKSYYIDNDLDSDHGSVGSGDSGGEDLGDPVYTRGMIETISGDILANPNGGNNYISLRNDISGSAAYFGFDGDRCPYMEVETQGAYGYMEACPTTTNVYLSAPDEAKIEMYADNGGSVKAFASNGSIFNSGVIHPFNACGQVNISGGSGSVTTNVTADASSLVLLTRKSKSAGTYGSLTYNFTGTTLTVYSDNNETSVINYFIISSSATTP